MNQVTRVSIQGLEHDFLATDSNGYIAFFSTAGGGYAPDEFLQDIDAFDRAISAILEQAPRATPLADPEQGTMPGDIWHRMAERGIYAFDSSPNGGPYRLNVKPSSPTHISRMPAEVSGVASRIILKNIQFSQTQLIHEEQLCAPTRD